VAATLGRLQVPQFLPLYASLEEALDAAVDRPPYLRDELRLAPTLTAAAVARAHVRDILTYWQLALPDTTVVERAVLVASELVTNAVVHAASQCAAAADLGAEVRGPGRDFHDAAPCRLDLTFLIGVPLDRRSVLWADLRLPEQIRASTSAGVG
jgi:hypothetical protein